MSVPQGSCKQKGAVRFERTRAFPQNDPNAPGDAALMGSATKGCGFAIAYEEKLEPHPQVCVAFGLSKVKPRALSPSW